MNETAAKDQRSNQQNRHQRRRVAVNNKFTQNNGTPHLHTAKKDKISGYPEHGKWPIFSAVTILGFIEIICNANLPFNGTNTLHYIESLFNGIGIWGWDHGPSVKQGKKFF